MQADDPPPRRVGNRRKAGQIDTQVLQTWTEQEPNPEPFALLIDVGDIPSGWKQHPNAAQRPKIDPLWCGEQPQVVKPQRLTVNLEYNLSIFRAELKHSIHNVCFYVLY